MAAVSDAYRVERPPDYGEVITLLVGSTEERFIVHRDLFSTSKFFQAALNGEWKEAKGEPFKLPEVDEVAFLIYVHWLYTGRFHGLEMHMSCTSIHWCSYENVDFGNLFRVYILGDFLADKHVRNSVVDELLSFYARHKGYELPFEEIGTYWPMLEKDSGLGYLLIQLCVHYADPDVFECKVEDLPHDFIGGVACGLLAVNRSSLKVQLPLNREEGHFHDK